MVIYHCADHELRLGYSAKKKKEGQQKKRELMEIGQIDTSAYLYWGLK